MQFREIIYDKEQHVATITLNRPAKLNAYSEVMVHEILAALADARDDDNIRAVILTGAGRGFCSGGDISRDFQYPARYRGHKMEAMLEMRENMHVLVKFLRRYDKPTIAAINGAAVAGGLTLALCCDFRIAGESARLGDTSLRFALIPDEGGAYLFPQFMGLENALKMSLFSEVYPAHQAKDLGLVTEVVPDAELLTTARAWAERLAEGAARGHADDQTHDVQATDHGSGQRARRRRPQCDGDELLRRRQRRHRRVSRQTSAAIQRSVMADGVGLRRAICRVTVRPDAMTLDLLAGLTGQELFEGVALAPCPIRPEHKIIFDFSVAPITGQAVKPASVRKKSAGSSAT